MLGTVYITCVGNVWAQTWDLEALPLAKGIVVPPLPPFSLSLLWSTGAGKANH